ncbi:MAG: IS3 family transposase [Lachnospiraceae bacterium]|nr:IS3 family transposase [Lachnospiraceae bacterium]
MNKKRILFVILCIVILFVGIIGFTIRYIHYRNATISDSSGCITKYRISATIIGPVYWGNVGHSSKITIIDDHEEVYIVDLYDDNCTILRSNIRTYIKYYNQNRIVLKTKTTPTECREKFLESVI